MAPRAKANGVRRRRRTFRSPAAAIDEARDPLEVAVATIRLTEAQHRIVERAGELEDNARFGRVVCGAEFRSADVLTDWGLVTQHQRGAVTEVRITERGRVYLRRHGNRRD